MWTKQLICMYCKRPKLCTLDEKHAVVESIKSLEFLLFQFSLDIFFWWFWKISFREIGKSRMTKYFKRLESFPTKYTKTKEMKIT